jgi:hypothetical protein
VSAGGRTPNTFGDFGVAAGPVRDLSGSRDDAMANAGNGSMDDAWACVVFIS